MPSPIQTLEDASCAILKLRQDISASEVTNNIDNICLFASAHLLQGMAQLEAAQHSILLAQLHMARALASSRH